MAVRCSRPRARRYDRDHRRGRRGLHHGAGAAVTIFTGRRTCRGCGCDDDHACITDTGPCAWVLLDVDGPTGVCTACAGFMGWHQDGLRLVGMDPWGGTDGDVLTPAEFAADPAGHARTLVLP
jgi:hypothetical protein